MEKELAFIDAIALGYSVELAAALVGIDVSTAEQWFSKLEKAIHTRRRELSALPIYSPAHRLQLLSKIADMALNGYLRDTSSGAYVVSPEIAIQAIRTANEMLRQYTSDSDTHSIIAEMIRELFMHGAAISEIKEAVKELTGEVVEDDYIKQYLN